jgi:uncharacterized protein
LATGRVAAYFGLVSLLTVPFWVLGALVNDDLLPGLPIAALAVVCPTIAAALLSLHEGGRAKVFELFGRGVDLRGVGRWLIPAILINPVLFGIAFILARQLGADIPNPASSAVSALVLFALFLLGAVLEELGWSGYALDRLLERVGPASAALSLGAFWALWHIPALVQVGRSLEWIAWWCLWTVSARVIMVWLYNWSGASVMAVAIYHAASNLCWQIYPVSGSYFDPRVSGLIAFALAAALVVWRQRAPSR